MKRTYEFEDEVPELLSTQKAVYGEEVPIVVDCGSHFTRVGWGGEKDPRLSFQTLVGKGKTKSTSEENVFLGNTCLINSKKLVCRSPFDSNVIVRFDAYESILDFSFERLGITSSGNVPHPILSTEPLCNLTYSRSHTSELFFECYGVPAVSYGIDSLFALYQKKLCDFERKNDPSSLPPPPCDLCRDSLVISIGNHVTHVYAVLDGKVYWNKVVRLSVGGAALTKFLFDTLNLNYPNFKSEITETRCDFIKSRHCYVSLNFDENIRAFDPYSDLRTFRQRDDNLKFGGEKRKGEGEIKCWGKKFEPHQLSGEQLESICLPLSPQITEPPLKKVIFQLPVPEAPVVDLPTEEELREKEKKRVERGKKLAESIKQRKEKKVEEKKYALEVYEQLLSLKETNLKKFQAQISKYDFDDEKDLKLEIKKIKKFLQKQEPEGERKQRGEEEGEKGEDGKEEEGEEDKEEREKKEREREEEEERRKREDELLAKKDEELGEEERKKKKVLRLVRAQKAARERERNAKKEREEEERRRGEEERRREEEIERERLEDPEGWLRRLKTQKTRLEYSMKDLKRRQERGEGRHGSQTQKRMKLLAEASMSIDQDGFGKDDKDWSVYEEMASSADQQITQMLKKQEKELSDLQSLIDKHEDSDSTAYQIGLGVERLRVAEVLFRPYLIGVDEVGIGEAIEMIFRSVNDDQRRRLAQSVFVTGGGSFFHHLRDRVEMEVRQLCPEGTTINVLQGEDVKDAWRGASRFTQTQSFHDTIITSKMYQEYGPSYLVEHFASNLSGLRLDNPMEIDF